MLNKRGCSYGAQYPFHYEHLVDGWSVFDARTDEVQEWEAQKLALELNGSPKPYVEDYDDEG